MDLVTLTAAVLYAPQMVLASSSTNADISTFLGYATSILTWLITSFGSILTFMLANPICFVWLIISIIGAAFVFLRRTIGG